MGVHTVPQRKEEARQPEPEPKSPHDGTHVPDDFSNLPVRTPSSHETHPEQEPKEELSHVRCLFAEFFGTAALTTVAAGGAR